MLQIVVIRKIGNLEKYRLPCLFEFQAIESEERENFPLCMKFSYNNNQTMLKQG